MKILRQNKGEKAKVATYTRTDMGPVKSATDDVKWFIVEETEQPPVSQFETVSSDYELTDKKHKKHPYFLVAIEKYIVTLLPDDVILQMLNNSLGEWLDRHYILPTQIKHLFEIATNKASAAKKQNIDALTAWQYQCRTLRDQREDNYFNKGELPDLTWPAPPTVLKSTKI